MPVEGDFYCKTCSVKMKARLAGDHHRKGHDVWHVDGGTGEFTHRYGERRKESFPVPKTSPEKKPLKITAEGDEHIREHAKGYEKDQGDVVFILHPETGQIKDMRHEFPLLYPIYELVKRDLEYGGTFPQFLADGIESLFASAGYELVLAPRREREVYDEMARLRREGKLTVSYDEKGLRLEVNHGYQIEGSERGLRGEGHNDKPPGEGEPGQEEEPTQPE